MPTEGQYKKFFKSESQYQLFCLIREYISSLGEVQLRLSKTQISFKTDRQFAWVWLPMAWDKRRPRGSIVLSFALNIQVKNRRIVQSVEPHTNIWMHHIIIQKQSDIDTTVRQYLKRSYIWSTQ